jgi:tetratricopeptide (TPR) repeat protein
MRVDEARALAAADPDDVEAQIAAAWACDTAGLEAEALVYYDRAFALGVPASKRAEFALGYGSTLRNNGRRAEAVRVLEDAVRAHPEARPLRAFLALALHSAGRPAEALALALETLAEGDPTLARYRRALAGYVAELRRPTTGAGG